MTGFSKDKSRRRVKRTIREMPKFKTAASLGYAQRLVLSEGRLRASFADSVLAKAFEIDGNSVEGFSCVHAYVDLPKLPEVMSALGGDTEDGHAKSLQLVSSLYAGCDRLTDNTDVARVDYHIGRVHIVRARPLNDPCTSKDVAEVASLCKSIGALGVQLIIDFTGITRFGIYRAGIDTGPCAAWDDGDRDGNEIVFVGSPANHAAKLANGDKGGIYLTSAAIRLLSGREEPEAPGYTRGIAAYNFSDQLNDVREDLRKSYETFVADDKYSSGLAQARLALNEENSVKDFKFSKICLPLSDLKFANLSPSLSKRSPMTVLFADVAGFTAFVDYCIKNGDFVTPVKYLYVLRQELRDCLTEDFYAKKVRFIGDCIQAGLAEGESYTIDGRATAEQTAFAAHALHQAVKICCEELGSEVNLEISVGAEFARTAFSRTGLRGDRAVKVASGSACYVSEECQNDCPAGELRMGPALQRLVPAGLQDLYVEDGRIGIVSKSDIERAVAKGIKRPAIVTSSLSSASYAPRAEAKFR